MANIDNIKHTYINTHGGKGNWIIKLEFHRVEFCGHPSCTETFEIKGYRRAINYLKRNGWQWAKLAKKG